MSTGRTGVPEPIWNIGWRWALEMMMARRTPGAPEMMPNMALGMPEMIRNSPGMSPDSRGGSERRVSVSQDGSPASSRTGPERHAERAGDHMPAAYGHGHGMPPHRDGPR
ncbi:hypothetical protein Tdes44962_MAKER07502 [Teratosphaeria destructans]|uniref:Uncharacterized protein n=1 Tax=Teratosphaeria destructans TaxID=418781 RepID=A0A9W7W641_9PEZI|nr:hypothetical protein Tdes44962_MAKER07502 [Teratosphaeria destructans]